MTNACIKCGSCVQVCPVIRSEGASIFPGPRRLGVEAPRYARELSDLLQPVLMCNTCSMCDSVCPSKVDITRCMLQIRSSHFSEKELSAGHKQLIDNIDRWSLAVPPSDPIGREIAAVGSTLYFPGCIGKSKIPKDS